ncbi:MAG: SHOCT domain-containing protein [Desulfobacteraceae bacterium]|nr:SHOCT domain-containing protein [Desulfobacteraceae bacterium]MCF8094237.1 SHOCT domain-containing protein [Desulfobacteraceae bacterium]
MKLRRVLSFGFAFILSLMLFQAGHPALAQRGNYGDWHMGPGMMGGWGVAGWFGGIFMLVVWVLVIVGLIYLIKWLVQSTKAEPGKSGTADSTRSLEILKERYARGEIEKTEFEEKKKDLVS